MQHNNKNTSRPGSPNSGSSSDTQPSIAADSKPWRPPQNPPSVQVPFPEPPEFGINQWIYKATVHCKNALLSAEDAAAKIAAYEPKLRRPFNRDEIERAIRKVYHSDRNFKIQSAHVPNWPTFDAVACEQAIANSPVKTLAELIGQSDPIPAEGVVDHVLDALYPGNPLLCFGGEGAHDFGTVHRENLRGQLEFTAQIVPSPMTSPLGYKTDGSGLSAHTLDNTGPRKYLVVEFDNMGDLDRQAAVVGHLSQYAPLVCVVFSGGKSLHAWFHVEGFPESEVLRFFRYAVKLGADKALWTRSQFARLPGGWNHAKGARQEVYFLKPGVTMGCLPPPPGTASGYPWQLKHGVEQWTSDPAEIANLSAPLLIDGLIRQGDVGVLVGGAKTHKTWVSLMLAIAVANGRDFLGYRTSAIRTLYLDYELREGTFRKRMCMLTESRPVGFVYQTLRGEHPLPTLEQIEDLIVNQGFGLVVLDSLYRTGLIKEENNNDSTSRDLTVLQEVATRTGAAILVVDHTAKGGGNDRSAVDAARGASAKGGFFDCILVMRPAPKSEDPEVTQVILDAVVRDWPPHTKLPLISFRWGTNSCRIELAGSVSPDDPQLSLSKILEVLEGRTDGISTSEIQKASGLPETTIRNGLKKLEATGGVIREPDPAHAQRHLFRIPGRDSTVG